jgi:hypothetical protein
MSYRRWRVGVHYRSHIRTTVINAEVHPYFARGTSAAGADGPIEVDLNEIHFPNVTFAHGGWGNEDATTWKPD